MQSNQSSPQQDVSPYLVNPILAKHPKYKKKYKQNMQQAQQKQQKQAHNQIFR